MHIKKKTAVICFFMTSKGGHGTAEVSLGLYKSIQGNKRLFEFKENKIYSNVIGFNLEFFQRYADVFYACVFVSVLYVSKICWLYIGAIKKSPEDLRKKIRKWFYSYVFLISETPSFVFDSFRVKFFAKFFAKISKLSFPCFPVKVFAFFVLTNNPLIIFL